MLYFTGELCRNVFIQLWDAGWLVSQLLQHPPELESVIVVIEAVHFSKTQNKPL